MSGTRPTNQVRPDLDALESRTVLSTVMMGSRGTLLVYGTAGDDAIQVGQDTAGQVVIEGQAYGGVSRVRVMALEGNDQVTFDPSVTVRAEVYGAAGNDVIQGGSGNDALYGGEGNDVLSGGAGNDYLDGWSGDDSFDGGDGWDTAYDSEVAAFAASVESSYRYW